MPAVQPLPDKGISPSRQTLQQAAEWFALLRSGEATDADRARWQDWARAAEENTIAWQYVERINCHIEPLRAKDTNCIAAGAYCRAGARLAQRKVLACLAFFACLFFLGWSAWAWPSLSHILLAWRADYSTAVGEVREMILSDGSQIWVSSASGFDQHYDAAKRDLDLLAGEILIQTAADALRPFSVHTRQGKLQALGTRFSVRLDRDDSTIVTVFEGRVKIHTALTGKSSLINAGEQRRFTSASIGDAQKASPGREAWIHGVLIVENLPLSKVVEELSRYHGGRITVSPQVADLPVFGSYPITDIDHTLDMLASVMPIRIKKTMSRWIAIEPKL